MIERVSTRFESTPGARLWEVTGLHIAKAKRTTFTVSAETERKARAKVRAQGYRIESSKEVTE